MNTADLDMTRCGRAWSSVIGVLLAAVPLLTGNASVLYTFYPPLMAHPAFYIGATLLVVGSWVWCLQMVMMMTTWKKAHPGETVPLAMFGTTANAILWFITSLGVASEVLFQLIPWSLGIIEAVGGPGGLVRRAGAGTRGGGSQHRSGGIETGLSR
jgi:cytochrome c oxidase subunit 1